MLFLKATLVVALEFAVQVASHGHPTFVEVVQSQERYECFQPYRYEWATLPTCTWRDHEIVNHAYVPVSEYNNRNINCNVNATPADVYVEVEAGDEIIIEWTAWPESHHGPVITYLGACNGDCADVDLDAVQWVKIDAVGQIAVGTTNSDAGYWAADKLRDDGNKARVKIPSSIQAGNFLCRHEIIALMGASNLGVAQNYPNCINLKISGSGTDPLPSGTLGRDLYKATDPGIHVMIYGTKLNYQIPGPPLYTGGSSNGTNTTQDGQPTDVGNTDKKTTPRTYRDGPTPVHPSNGTAGTKFDHTSNPSDYTKPTNHTTPNPEDSTTSKPDDQTTPKSHYTSDTTDSDLKVPDGASASQLLDIIDRCVQALRKAVGNRRRHARAIHS